MIQSELFLWWIQPALAIGSSQRYYSSGSLSGSNQPIFFLLVEIGPQKTGGPGALKLGNSIAKYQLQVCQKMYIYAPSIIGIYYMFVSIIHFADFTHILK